MKTPHVAADASRCRRTSTSSASVPSTLLVVPPGKREMASLCVNLSARRL